MAVSLPPPCPVWVDTHPASADHQSSQEVIVPDDSSEPGQRMEHLCSEMRFKIAAKYIRSTIASKSAIQVQVQDFADDDSLTYSDDESSVDDNDSFLGVDDDTLCCSEDDDDIEIEEEEEQVEQMEEEEVVVESAAYDEQEEEVGEEEKRKRTSSPVRRSERIRHRGLGSQFTQSGRRYSKRLAAKK